MNDQKQTSEGASGGCDRDSPQLLLFNSRAIESTRTFKEELSAVSWSRHFARESRGGKLLCRYPLN